MFLRGGGLSFSRFHAIPHIPRSSSCAPSSYLIFHSLPVSFLSALLPPLPSSASYLDSSALFGRGPCGELNLSPHPWVPAPRARRSKTSVQCVHIGSDACSSLTADATLRILSERMSLIVISRPDSFPRLLYAVHCMLYHAHIRSKTM